MTRKQRTEDTAQPLTRGRTSKDDSVVGRKILADCYDGRWMSDNG